MKITLKKILPFCTMIAILASFCNPSQAALTAQTDWAELSYPEVVGPGTYPVSITSYYSVTNTGFKEDTATFKTKVYSPPNPPLGSGSKDTTVSPHLTVYDSHNYTVSVEAYNTYYIDLRIVEKVFPSNVLFQWQDEICIGV